MDCSQRVLEDGVVEQLAGGAAGVEDVGQSHTVGEVAALLLGVQALLALAAERVAVDAQARATRGDLLDRGVAALRVGLKRELWVGWGGP